jgi:Methylamine utilisation protein MauE
MARTMLLLIGVVVRLLIGGLLVVAGAGKLMTGAAERERWLRAYGILPSSIVPPAAVAVSAAELLAGTALILGLGGQLSIGLGAAALVLVTGGATLALARGRRPDCGCFGRWASAQLSWWVVIRNLALIALLAVIGGKGLVQPGIAAWPIASQVVAMAAVASAIVFLPRRATTAGVQPSGR